jgi:hypothetical protein
MSHRVANRVKQDSTTKHGARLVLLLLADYADDAGVCWPGHSTLCQDAGLSERQLTRILQALTEKGDISVLKRGDGRGNNTVYRLEKYADAPFHPSWYEVLCPTGKGDISSIKGDIIGEKGDISGSDEDVPSSIKGDIIGRAYKDEPSGEVKSPLSPPRVGAVDSEPDDLQQAEQQAIETGEEDGTEGDAEGTPPDTSGANPQPKRQKRAPVVLTAEQQRLFDCWYEHYPNKAGRQKAVEAWAKINPDPATVKAMAEGLKRWKESRDWKTLGAIKHPATWLNQRNWEDTPQRADEVRAPTKATGGSFGIATAFNGARPASANYTEYKGDDD